jgi:hypothetical protein
LIFFSVLFVFNSPVIANNCSYLNGIKFF